MKQKLLLLFISIFILSTSCNTQKTKKSEDEKNEISIEKTIVVKSSAHSISDIKAIFDLADVSYYNDIVNKPTNALNYVGNKKIAANIGVYLGDMLYAMTTSGVRKDAYPSYGAVMELAKHFGLTGEFPNIIIDRYINDSVLPDSVLVLLQNALDNSEKKLSESDKSEFFAFVTLGNYIEKLYIISNLIEKPNDKDIPEEASLMLKRDLLLLMGKQSEPLGKLLTVLSNHSENSSNVMDLDEIKELINNYKIVGEKREDLLQLKPSELYQAKEIVAIFKQIEKVRNRIVIQ